MHAHLLLAICLVICGVIRPVGIHTALRLFIFPARWIRCPAQLAAASCWRCVAGGGHQWAVRAADGERRAALLFSDVPHRRSSSCCSHTPCHRHASVPVCRCWPVWSTDRGGTYTRAGTSQGSSTRTRSVARLPSTMPSNKAVLKTVVSRRVVGCLLRYPKWLWAD
jgi:hypothetical protein